MAEAEELESSMAANEPSFPDDSDEDDPVVEEYPIYLNHDLTGQLHLFQYQNRPSTLAFGDEEVLDVKYKPESKKLQMVMEIDTKTKFYDNVAGMQMTTGKSKIDVIEDAEEGEHPGEIDEEKDDTDKDVIFNRQVVEYDAHPRSQESGYYVCIKHKKAIHITPIATVGQARPVFPCFDEDDIEAAATGDGKDTLTDASESEAESEDTGKIQVTFKKEKKTVAANVNVEQVEAQLSQNYAKHLEQDAEDAWVKLDYTEFDEEVWHKLRTNNDEIAAEAGAAARPKPSEVVLFEGDDDEPMLVDLEPGSSPSASPSPEKRRPRRDDDSVETHQFLNSLVTEEQPVIDISSEYPSPVTSNVQARSSSQEPSQQQ